MYSLSSLFLILLILSSFPSSLSQAGFTALMIACWEGHGNVVDRLLEGGATVDLHTDVGPVLQPDEPSALSS